MDLDEDGVEHQKQGARKSMLTALEAAISVKVRSTELHGPHYRYRWRESELRVRWLMLITVLAGSLLAFLVARGLEPKCTKQRIPQGLVSSPPDKDWPDRPNRKTAAAAPKAENFGCSGPPKDKQHRARRSR